jgi:exodeoxyribonuclease VII small subunit
MANLAAPEAPDTPPAFEDAVRRIEQIVAELEEGRTGLEASLQRYEEGVGLLQHCLALLTSAERRIELLTGLDSRGQPVTQPFDATASAAPQGEGAATPVKRSRRTRTAVAPEPSTGEPPPESDVDTPGKLF